MKSITAALFVTVIVGLMAQRREALRTAALAGLAVFSVAALALVEYVGGADFGTGQIFGKDQLLIETVLPGRMAIPTSISFLASGLALMLLPFRHGAAVTIRRVSIALVLVMSLAVVIGLLYDAREIRGTGGSSPMALPTAIAFILAGLVAGTPRTTREWPVNLWSGSGLTGRISRLLLPTVILLPILAGSMRLFAEKQGWVGRELGVTFMVVFHIAALTTIVLCTLTQLEVAEGSQRAHEAMLSRHSAELQQANRELEAFSYSVSHDLRAPLRAIDGYSRMLEEDYGAVVDDDGKRYLGVVRSEARRMAVLIDDLLAFSQLSKSSLDPVELDLAEMSRVIAAELRKAYPARPIELRIGELPIAQGDRATIRQVLVNFLSNAVKYSGLKDSTPIVIEMNGETNGHEVVYSIRDYGVGFEMRYAEKLFGVFQRLHSAEEFEGTGVGLAIVERVITRHGGRVWAKGQPGEGSTFFFSLPSLIHEVQNVGITNSASAGIASTFDQRRLSVQ